MSQEDVSPPSWLPDLALREDWLRAHLEDFEQLEVESLSQRAWAWLWRLRGRDRDVIFKVSHPSMVHDPRVTQWLARRWPARALPVLAVEPELGFTLTPYQGETLGDRIKGGELQAQPCFEGLFASWGRWQIEIGQALVDDPLREHIPGARAAELEQWFLRMAEAVLEPAQLRRLRGGRAPLTAILDRLAESAIPATLVHNDLHAWNAFWRRDAPVVFDWGDSLWGHPLLDLRVMQGAARRDLGEEHLEALTQAYLRPFLEAGWVEQEELAGLLVAASVGGSITRAMSWWGLIELTNEQEHRAIVAQTLVEVLDELESLM